MGRVTVCSISVVLALLVIFKPWLTKGVLTSVKCKQTLYESHFLSRDPNKVKEYKLYANVLNSIKNKAINDYYRQRFKFYRNANRHLNQKEKHRTKFSC